VTGLAETRQALLAASLDLPSEKQALLTSLGSLGVSDQAFVAALAIVQMLGFNRHAPLRFWVISEMTGLPAARVAEAIEELLERGMLERWTHQRRIRRANWYRLARPR
jgi:Fic family protein